jgi:hypothetical protein
MKIVPMFFFWCDQSDHNECIDRHSTDDSSAVTTGIHVEQINMLTCRPYVGTHTSSPPACAANSIDPVHVFISGSKRAMATFTQYGRQYPTRRRIHEVQENKNAESNLPGEKGAGKTFHV